MASIYPAPVVAKKSVTGASTKVADADGERYYIAFTNNSGTAVWLNCAGAAVKGAGWLLVGTNGWREFKVESGADRWITGEWFAITDTGTVDIGSADIKSQFV